MHVSRFFSLLTLIVFWAGPAAAADLAKVDRTVAKEPAYKAKPKYCLLVFGPDTKHRVWLILDGDTLYVDKNGNGDLTEEGERVHGPAFAASTHPAHERERSVRVGDITVAGLTHTGLEVSQIQYRRKVPTSGDLGLGTAQEWQDYLDSIYRQVPDGLIYTVSINLDAKCYGLFEGAKTTHVNHFAWVDRHGQLTFADRAKDAPVVHFGGPLTLRVNPSDKLRRGNDPPDTTLCLGTPGLGAGAFATMCYDLVPRTVQPTVEVQFPPKELGQPPVTRKYVLSQRC